METEKEAGYPWPLFVRTLLLWFGFFGLGVVEAVKGPTLLDLEEVMNAELSEISWIITLGSLGYLLGSFAVGLLMDRLMRFRYAILAAMTITFGLASSLMPYSIHLVILYTLALVSGFGAGAFDTGCNVLCLDIWKGRESGPYMHALHFTFGMGAFAAPVLAKPFLSEDPESVTGNATDDLTEQRNESLSIFNVSGIDSTAYNASDNEDPGIWTIKTLYPITGLLPLVISLGFLFYFFVDLLNEKKNPSPMDETVQNSKKDYLEEKPADAFDFRTGDKRVRKVVWTRILVVAQLAVFFFLYVGAEVSFGTFLTVFAVKSKLGLTRQIGSVLTAIFWGCFAAARGLAIFAAIFLSADTIMWSSFITAFVGSSVLAFFGENTLLTLQIGSGLLGIGCASIFATGFLWLEKRVVISNKIGAILTISSSLGAKLFPILIGNTVEDHPMSFLYIIYGVICGCILLFTSVSLTARHLEILSDTPQATPPQDGEEMKRLHNLSEDDILFCDQKREENNPKVKIKDDISSGPKEDSLKH